MKANKLSTRRKDSRTNHKGALTAEEQGSSRETMTTEAASAETEASAIGGKRRRARLSFLSPKNVCGHGEKI